MDLIKSSCYPLSGHSRTIWSPSFCTEADCLQLSPRLKHSRQTDPSEEWVSEQGHPEIKPFNTQRNGQKCASTCWYFKVHNCREMPAEEDKRKPFWFEKDVYCLKKYKLV